MSDQRNPNHFHVREEPVTDEERIKARGWSLRGEVGWRAVCSCGWRAEALRGHQLTAYIEGERHECLDGGWAIYSFGMGKKR